MWRDTGLAFFAASGACEEGLAVFKAWSEKSAKHDEENTEKAWREYHRSPPSRIGAGSLFRRARLADPHWRYEATSTTDNRDIENHYPAATLPEIFEHIKEIELAPDVILFLWATAPKLADAISVMYAWGFSHRSCAIWDKTKIGMGYWFRIQHELLLVGVRGNPNKTPESERVSSIFVEARTAHSIKPECGYQWIERAFPDLPKLEMYCRKPRIGWAAWGNES